MTPYKKDIFHEVKAVLAVAEPEQIKLLLSDIASGQFPETAQTRAGANDNHSNVLQITGSAGRASTANRLHANALRHHSQELRERSAQLSKACRDLRQKRYSS
jgi:hypothetical protein